MLSSTLLTTLAAAATVSAAKVYIPYAWNDTAPIHGMAVQARNGYFYLGGDAYPICEDDDFECAAHNKTLITGPLPSKYSDNLDAFFLHITESQPQEVVTHPRGELMFTLPQTDLGTLVTSKTYGTINTPFSVDQDDYSNQTVLRFNGNDFVACMNRGDNYGIQPFLVKALSYGDVVYSKDLGCTPFKMRLVETDIPAPAHYKFPCSTVTSLISPDMTCLDTQPRYCYESDAHCTEEEKKTWTIKYGSNMMDGNCTCMGLGDDAVGQGVVEGNDPWYST